MHTTSPASRRALAGTVMVLSLLAGLSACSGDDGESTPTTTESAQQEDGVEVTESTIPLSTVPDDEFANVVDGLSAQIESAPDSCALLSIIFNAGSSTGSARPTPPRWWCSSRASARTWVIAPPSCATQRPSTLR